MRYMVFVFVLSLFWFTSIAQVNYEEYFEMFSMRIDYLHVGNSATESIILDKIKKEPYWAGSKVTLIDPFNYGEYRIKVFDSTTNRLIYSRGFGSLFREWQTTKEAKIRSKGIKETVIFPYPKNTVKVVIESRNKQNIFGPLLTDFVNPANYFISNEAGSLYNTFKTLSSNIPSKCIDLVIIAEGYTEKEMIKFRLDAKRFTEYLFNCSPFKENKNKFNIRAIEAISGQSGPDIPKENVWNNTALDCSFYTFDSERYLMTMNITKVRDIASTVPYDQIIILVNSDKYGGGGIYNFYNVCSSDNKDSEFVFTHEFGHGFAALADEYYTSDVAYTNYYDLAVEPFQANITTLVNFESKWKSLVDNSTPIPTPATDDFQNVIGAFEGGGYVEHGIYRPMQDCSMKSRIIDGFCPVCKKAIQEMIDAYTK